MYKTLKSHLVAIVVIIAICFGISREITDKPIVADAFQNLVIAYNLKESGTFAMPDYLIYPHYYYKEDCFEIGDYFEGGALKNHPDHIAHSVSTNYRELIPPLVISAWMTVHPKLRNADTLYDYYEGELARTLKYANLLWISLALLMTYLITLRFTDNRYLSLLPAVLTGLYWLRAPAVCDTFLNELPAGSVCLLVVWLFLRAWASMSLRSWALVGLASSVLVLIKSLFFYIFSLFIVCALIGIALHYVVKRKVILIKPVLVFGIGFICLVSPWMIRNKILFDTTSLSSRGGTVLYLRGKLNQINHDEVLGGLYHWGPLSYRVAVRGSEFEFEKEDFLLGGKASRINYNRSDFTRGDLIAELSGKPEGAVGILRSVRALRVRLREYYKAQGFDNYSQKADAHLKSEGIAMILSDPISHVLKSGLFFWRGMWCLYPMPIYGLHSIYASYAADMLTILVFLGFLASWVYAILKRFWAMVAFVLIPTAFIATNTLLSQNEPRYLTPMVPFLLVNLVCIVFIISKDVLRKLFAGKNKKI